MYCIRPVLKYEFSSPTDAVINPGHLKRVNNNSKLTSDNTQNVNRLLSLIDLEV